MSTRGAAATEGVSGPTARSSEDVRVSRFNLSLLRSFELRREDEVVTLPMSVQRLLAYLALRGRPLQRVHVAGTLWLDATEEHANGCLRTALWRLRRLDDAIVRVTSTQLGLSQLVAVDVRETTKRAVEILSGRGVGDDAVFALAHSGELLPDWYDDWVLIERERTRQLVMHALERLSADARAGGRFAEAAEAALAAVSFEPLRESAHRLVVEAHLGDGNLGEAIRHYRLFARLIRAQLGLEPSQQMKALIAGLPNGDD
jgi:DNA-binding SARP family transcriptional activator